MFTFLENTTTLSRIKIIGIHIVAWLAFLVLNNVLLVIDGSLNIIFKRILITYSLVAALFYINAYFIVDELYKKKYIRFITYTLLLIVVYSICRYLIFSFLFPIIGIDTSYKNISIFSKKFSLDTIWLAFQYLFYSYGYWFALHKIRLERESKLFTVAMVELDKAKAEAELAFLQAQINPHFLFNTFNFLYSEAIKYSDKLADAILILTSMMRTITEVSAEKFIPLKKELEYISNYIKIQQYRFNEQLDITLEINGEEDVDFVYVPPLLFTSFVENIFKHGDVVNYPTIIRCNVHDDKVYFYTFNYKKNVDYKNIKNKKHIGLDNSKKQLEILYKERYSLDINNNESSFSVELCISEEDLVKENINI